MEHAWRLVILEAALEELSGAVFDPRMLEAAEDLDLDQVMDKKKYVSIGG